MSIYTEKTVRDLAVAVPGATRVFEEMGIDYCCGGSKPLPEACSKAGIPLQDITEALDRAKARYAKDAPADWQSSSLTELAAYIVEKHHVYTQNEISRLEPLSAKVASVHAERHPELIRVQGLVHALGSDLKGHMLKEEQVLFPRIHQLEEAAQSSEALPDGYLDFIRMPVQCMMQEHDAAGEILKELREVSDGYAVPADGCISYKTLYQAIQELERDLHQHIHLENNILFPRALALGK